MDLFQAFQRLRHKTALDIVQHVNQSWALDVRRRKCFTLISMPGNDLERFRNSVREARDALLRLHPQIKQQRDRERETRDVEELRQRAHEKLSQGISHWFRETYPFLDPEKRRQRLVALSNGRQSQFHVLWEESGAFFDDLRKTFEGLRPVLGVDEVARLISEVNSNLGSLDAIEAIVRRTSQRVDEFCPVEPMSPGTTASREELEAKRSQMLAESRNRWYVKTGGRRVPFSWVYAAAGVDKKDAYGWKNGKLSTKSQMSVSIERVLREPFPPKSEIPSE